MVSWEGVEELSEDNLLIFELNLYLMTLGR